MERQMLQPTRRRLLTTLATFGAVLSATPVLAETLRCRSVNGNVTCAGSNGTSCQTVNGRTTCVSGSGTIVQQFGAAPSGRPAPPVTEEESDLGPDHTARRRLWLERHGPGSPLSIEREGSRLRLRRDGMSLDID
jgi:hypothetical protein